MDLDALIAHLALDSGRLALAIVMAQSTLAIALVLSALRTAIAPPVRQSRDSRR